MKLVNVKKQNKSIIFTFIIMVVIFAIVTFAYTYLNFTIINEKSEKEVASLNESITYTIENVVTTYNDEILEEYQKNQNQNKDVAITTLYNKYSYKENNSIIATGYYSLKDDVRIYYDNKMHTDKFIELNNDRYNEKVSFIDLSNFFENYKKDENVILHSITLNDYTYFAIQSYQEIEKAFSTLYKSANNKYYYIASNDGAIYISNYQDKYPNLSVLFDNQNKASNFIYEIKNHGASTTTLKINDENYYIIGNSMLDDYNNYNFMFISVVSNSFVKNYYSSIKLLSIIFAILILIILMASFWIVSLALSSKYLIVSKDRFTFKYAKGYSLLATFNGKIIMSNKEFKKIGGGYHNLYDFDLEETNKNMKDYLTSGKSFTAKFLDSEGKVLYIRFYIVRVRSMYHLIGDVENERSLAGSKIRKIAYYNPVSNILNINALNERIAVILKNKEKKTILCFDIINFKNINNLFGSSFGDDVICYMTDFIKKEKEENDEIYSLQAEKVALVIDTLDDYGAVFEKAKKIYDKLIKPQTINLNELNLAIGCGIYEINTEDTTLTPTKVIENIVMANKRSHTCEGRKIYTYDKGLYQLLERESIIIEDIKKAITNDEFVVYYQPQYDLSSNKVAGFEALLRWTNPKYANESPFEYIKLAERTNLIVQIGNIVNRQSFKAARILYDKGYKAHISVNVSIAQLLQSGFVSSFLKLYEEFNIPYSYISIEITETMLMTSVPEIKEKLTILKDKGIEIYLDDFGMGYSSLQYLNELPVSYIKLDREFIRYLQHSKSSRIIVGKFLDMANELGIDSVAEGVEDQYQVNYLMKHKCHLIQGYIVSKAFPVEDIERMMNISKKINTKLDDISEDDTLKNNSMFSKKVN